MHPLNSFVSLSLLTAAELEMIIYGSYSPGGNYYAPKSQEAVIQKYISESQRLPWIREHYILHALLWDVFKA